jgi:hypothetical protein
LPVASGFGILTTLPKARRDPGVSGTSEVGRCEKITNGAWISLASPGVSILARAVSSSAGVGISVPAERPTASGSVVCLSTPKATSFQCFVSNGATLTFVLDCPGPVKAQGPSSLTYHDTVRVPVTPAHPGVEVGLDVLGALRVRRCCVKYRLPGF